MDGNKALLRKLRSVVAILLVVLYLAGLVAMLTSNVQLGLILWVVSTLGGIGMLYWIHTNNKRREDAEKAAANDPSPEEP